MLMWSLKQFKDFILKFSISGRFFSEKEFFNLFTMILVSFPTDGYVDEVVDNQTNYQYHTLTFIHFMNREGVC